MAPPITQIKALIPLMMLIGLLGTTQPLDAQCGGVRADRVALIAGGFVAAQVTVIALRHDDWWTTPRRSFHVRTGGSPSAGQDLLLHGAIAYHTSRAATVAWRWACTADAAPWLGALTGLLVGLPKEIGDGLREEKGFAADDMAASAIGALLPALHATAPATRLVALKVFWWPSEELRNRMPGGLPQLENDYAGQRYWLSMVPGRVWDLPVRWLGLAVGHSTTTWATAPPQSEWYLALDVDLWHWIDAIKLPLPGLRISGGQVTFGLY
jgi:hypothetical protein